MPKEKVNMRWDKATKKYVEDLGKLNGRTASEQAERIITNHMKFGQALKKLDRPGSVPAVWNELAVLLGQDGALDEEGNQRFL